MVGNIFEVFGDLIAVEFQNAVAEQIFAAHTNGHFERKKVARLPAHARIISRYMLINQLPGTT